MKGTPGVDLLKQLHLFLGSHSCSTILKSSMLLEMDTVALMSPQVGASFVFPHISKHFSRIESEALYRIRT